MKTGKVYFPNLNALRFIAAFMVVFHHIEQFKQLYRLPSTFGQDSPFYLMGKLGVVLFFVLSGFLITFLLLKEEQVTSQINIRNFYIRRILKIWPLYFLIFIIGLYVLPGIPALAIDHYDAHQVQENLLIKTLLFVFFLPNLMMVAASNGDGFIPGANQLWSIGTEEQFYLFWPVIFKKIKIRRFTAMFAVIFGYLLLRYIASHLPPFAGQKNLLTFLGFFNIDCMAIGGLTAMICFHNKAGLLKVLYNRFLQWAVILATIFFIAKGYYLSKGYFTEIYGILFAIIILNLATNPRSVLNLETSWTNYLGKISYGIYMYHCLAVMIVITVLKYFSIATNLTIYLSTIALTLGFASISYTYFEERFIKMKVRFSKIVSGDNAKEEEAGQRQTNTLPTAQAPGI